MVARGAFAPDGAFYAVEHERQRGWVLRGGVWSDLAAQGLPAAPFLGVAVRGDQVLVSAAGGQMWCSADRGQSWTGMLHYQGAGAGDPPGWGCAPPAGSIWARSPSTLPIPTRCGPPPAPPFRAKAAQTCLWPVHWQSQARGIEELVATDIVQSPGRAPMFAALDFGIHVKADLGRFPPPSGRSRASPSRRNRWRSRPQTPILPPPTLPTRASAAPRTGRACWRAPPAMAAKAGSVSPPCPPRPAPARKTRGAWPMARWPSAGDPGNIVWAPGRNRAPFVTADYGASWAQVHLPGEVGQATGSFPNIWINRKTPPPMAPRAGCSTSTTAARRPTARWRPVAQQRWRAQLGAGVARRSGSGQRRRGQIARGAGAAGHLFFTSASSGADQRLRRSTDGGEHWAPVPGVEQVDDIAFGKAARGGPIRPSIWPGG
jgi:hypothetical protein